MCRDVKISVNINIHAESKKGKKTICQKVRDNWLLDSMMLKYVCICVIFLLISGFAEGDEPIRHLFSSDELLVKVHSKVAFNWSKLARFEEFARQLGAISTKKIFPTLRTGKAEIDKDYILRFPYQTNLPPIINSLKQSPLVEDVDYNYLRHPCAEQIEPNDAHYSEQWNLEAVRMLEAWSQAGVNGSKNLIIAVVDSGVDLEHEDLKEQFWQNPGEIPANGVDDDGNGYTDDVVGWDFSDAPTLDGTGDYTRRDNEPSDESGHGTHVAGIACAQTNNGIGIAGISWSCRLMPLRAGFNVASGGSFLQDDDVAAAIVYAADNGAKVINMSWGDKANAFVIRDAVNYAYERGCVLVAAAGNSDEKEVLYPAALQNVISVGAIDQNHQIASVSNYGEGVALFAPGVSILSTQIGNEYNTMSGTSMAAPHVSGIAGLVLSKYPGLTNNDVRNILISSASSTNVLLVNAARALASCLELSAKIQVKRATSSLVKRAASSLNEIHFIGNACGHGFEKYSIEYGKTATPVQWQKLYESETPAWNETLYRWNTSSLEEGTYAVRLSVFGRAQSPLIEKTLVEIDHSPPKIIDVKVKRWLDGNRFYTVITWNTDDEAICSVSYGPSGKPESQKANLFTDRFSQTHNMNFSELVEDGTYEFFITAQNKAGLTSVDDNDGSYYHAEVENILISSDQFTRLPASALPKMHLVDTVVDFDNDGLSELVGMEIGGAGYSTVRIYENTGKTTVSAVHFKPVFTSGEYFPWAVGDSDRDGLLEILGNNYETTFLIESSSPGEYPTKRIFQRSGIWGGQFADLDLDGQIEIVSKNSNTNCIDVYENTGNNSYSLTTSLENPTKGDNSLGANYALADFDGDGQTELAAGDADGDVFVYEASGNDRFISVWHERLEDSINAYDFAVGDLDGDGRDEFIVGSKSATDKFDFETWHRNYFAYTADGENSYRQVFKQQIRSERNSGNGSDSRDLDGDQVDEILIISQPHAYVFKKKGNGWKAIWYHSAESTFSPSVLDIDNNGTNELLFNLEDGLGIFGIEADSRLTSRPYGLTASMISSNSVRLHWQSDIQPLFYKIYRKTDERFLLLTEKIEENEFVDSSITQGATYWYAVSSVMPDEKETFLSDEVSVTTGRLPRLISAKYHPPNQVKLKFDKSMSSSAQNRNNYCLAIPAERPPIHKYVPSSAISDQSGRRVILNFDASVFSVGKYQLIVKDLRDTDGMPIDQEFRLIRFMIKNDVSQNLSQVSIYPNPVQPSQYGACKIIFGNVPAETTISIYTVSGELLEQLKVSENGDKRKSWWLSREGKVIASGVYLCVFELGGQRVTRKFCVIQ